MDAHVRGCVHVCVHVRACFCAWVRWVRVHVRANVCLGGVRIGMLIRRIDGETVAADSLAIRAKLTACRQRDKPFTVRVYACV